MIGAPIDFGGSFNLRHIAITPDGLRAYVTSDAGVHPLNLTNNTVGPVIPTGQATGIAILPDGVTALVAERNDDQSEPIHITWRSGPMDSLPT